MIDESDTDSELCGMEKSLEETTIELPTKVSFPKVNVEQVTTTENLTEERSAAPEESTSHADSLSHLLPANSFAQISPRCYMFPGAEVTLENMEAESEDSDDDFSEEEEEEENETASAIANEIIVPDIDDNVIEVPVPEVSPSPTTSSTLSPIPSSSHLQCNDRETAENIIDIQADEATEDLEPAPIKRPRLDNDGKTIC